MESSDHTAAVFNEATQTSTVSQHSQYNCTVGGAWVKQRCMVQVKKEQSSR